VAYRERKKLDGSKMAFMMVRREMGSVVAPKTSHGKKWKSTFRENIKVLEKRTSISGIAELRTGSGIWIRRVAL